MVGVLESHLSLLEEEAKTPSGTDAAERTAFVEDLVALHLAVFEAMERHLGADGLTESHRFMVPLFRRWIHSARLMIVAARDLKAAGVTIRLDPLLSAINRAKPVAEDFDHFVELNQRLDRGQSASHRALAEVVDELRSETQRPR